MYESFSLRSYGRIQAQPIAKTHEERLLKAASGRGHGALLFIFPVTCEDYEENQHCYYRNKHRFEDQPVCWICHKVTAGARPLGIIQATPANLRGGGYFWRARISQDRILGAFAAARKQQSLPSNGKMAARWREKRRGLTLRYVAVTFNNPSSMTSSSSLMRAFVPASGPLSLPITSPRAAFS